MNAFSKVQAPEFSAMGARMLGQDTAADFRRVLERHTERRSFIPPSLLVSEASLLISKSRLVSVAQSCPTLCDPMHCSTPGLPVHHQLPEFTQTRVHRVGEAIQPSHPLSSPSPP